MNDPLDVRPGQVWEETGPHRQRIVITGIADRFGVTVYYVPVDPNEPVAEASCRSFAFWPKDPRFHDSGMFRFVADAPDEPLGRVINPEYARAWAAHVLQGERGFAARVITAWNKRLGR